MQRSKVELADYALNNAALFVHNKAGGRQAHILKAFGYLAKSVMHHREGKGIFLCIVEYMVRRIIKHGDSDHFKTLSVILLVGFNQLRHFRNAAWAVSCPEIDQYHFAFKLAHFDGFTFYR